MSAVQTNAKDKGTADLMAQLAALQAENAKLKEQRNSKLSFKVSEKGCLSCYGMGRFPVSLYRGQWERLIEAVPLIKQAIEQNKDKLSTKD